MQSFMPTRFFVFKIQVIKMASQARKVFGAFEKRAPAFNFHVNIGVRRSSSAFVVMVWILENKSTRLGFLV